MPWPTSGHIQLLIFLSTTADGQIVSDAELTMSAFPHFLGQILPAGIIGLVGAGMLAAFMSTHDSYLLCWASVIVEDVVAPIRNGRISTQKSSTSCTDSHHTDWDVPSCVGSLVSFGSGPSGLHDGLWRYLLDRSIGFAGTWYLLEKGSRVGAYLALTAGSLAVFGLAPVQRN